MMNQLAAMMIVKGVFALINKLTGEFELFDWVAFKTSVWYYFTPRGLDHMLILYAVAGLVLPILLQQLINATKRCLPHRLKK